MDDPTRLVAEICDLLSREVPPAAELAATLGDVSEQGRSAVYVNPSAAEYDHCIVSRDIETGAVRSVELQPAASVSLRVALLERRFGAYTLPPRVSWNAPVRLRFRVDPAPDRPRVCVIVAAVVTGAAAAGESKVQSLTLIPELR